MPGVMELGIHAAGGHLHTAILCPQKLSPGLALPGRSTFNGEPSRQKFNIIWIPHTRLLLRIFSMVFWSPMMMCHWAMHVYPEMFSHEFLVMDIQVNDSIFVLLNAESDMMQIYVE
jgi:hypothetical protein